MSDYTEKTSNKSQTVTDWSNSEKIQMLLSALDHVILILWAAKSASDIILAHVQYYICRIVL